MESPLSYQDFIDESESQLDAALTNSQIPANVVSPIPHTVSRQTLPEKLQFLQLSEWDEHNGYEEDEPSCLHYSIE
jgi:hypothetical protein